MLPTSPRMRAHQQAADLNVIYHQYGQREQKDRREVTPPIEVSSAAWAAAGQLDYWVKERQEWWGRVRGSDGHQVWIKAADLRPLNGDGYHYLKIVVQHDGRPR